MPAQPPPAQKIAEHLIARYGRAKFKRLIEMFQANESGEQIASEFDVTRQRVHQWKIQLGHERVIFVIDPEIEHLVGVPTARRTTV